MKYITSPRCILLTFLHASRQLRWIIYESLMEEAKILLCCMENCKINSSLFLSVKYFLYIVEGFVVVVVVVFIFCLFVLFFVFVCLFVCFQVMNDYVYFIVSRLLCMKIEPSLLQVFSLCMKVKPCTLSMKMWPTKILFTLHDWPYKSELQTANKPFSRPNPYTKCTVYIVSLSYKQENLCLLT